VTPMKPILSDKSKMTTSHRDEAEDIAWAEYEQQIEVHIRHVEDHLELPHGTLADIRHDNDYLKILKMHATVEPLLNQLLERSVTRVMKHPKVFFPGGEAVAELILEVRLERKIKLALDCELINQQQATFIRMLARVRNYYAHSVANMPLDISEVAGRISPQDNGFSVEKALYGISKRRSSLVMVLLRPFIFYNFAHLIRSVVEGINPPPLLPGILLQAMHDTPETPADPPGHREADEADF
jgi:hypothetical protein